MKKYFYLLLIILIFSVSLYAEKLQIAVLKYRQQPKTARDRYTMGGVRNFIKEANKLMPLQLSTEPKVVGLGTKADDEDHDRSKLFTLPFIILNGHLPITLNEMEQKDLKDYLENGGFLFVNDDYGLDHSFRNLLAKLYPELEWFSKERFPPQAVEWNGSISSSGVVLFELSNNFPLFKSYYRFLPKATKKMNSRDNVSKTVYSNVESSALPKIHEHDGKEPKAYGLFIDKRMVLLYVFNSDIIDGWENESVHNDPKEIRDKAIRFGINILYYALSN